MSSPAPARSLSPARRSSLTDGSPHPPRHALDGGGMLFKLIKYVQFGFSWTRPVSGQNPDLRLLDFFGFPWILSSESRLINGLCGIKRAKIFLRRSSAASSARTGAHGRGRAEGQNWSSTTLARLPVFSKWLSPEPSGSRLLNRSRCRRVWRPSGSIRPIRAGDPWRSGTRAIAAPLGLT
jgi:hypothetical protein